MKNKQFYIRCFLLLSVVIVIVIKLLISIKFGGPQVIPDESCILVKAKELINTGRFLKCNSLFNRVAGDPFPLYPLLISPLYLFFKGSSFYSSVLVLNSLITLSIVFPLNFILKKLLNHKSWKINWFLILIVILSPSVFLFEYFALTETLYTALVVWCLYFYINSFEKNKILNKTKALIVALLASMTRPFGFVVVASILINELLLHKKNKKYIYVFVFFLIFTALLFLNFNGGVLSNIIQKFQSLNSIEHFGYLFQAFVNQINSLTWATFFIPLVSFFYYIFKEKNELFRKVRGFIVSLIFLTFIISFQHLFGYFLEGLQTSVATRYLSAPITIITIIGLGFMLKKDEIKFDLRLMLIILILSVFQLLVPQLNISASMSPIHSDDLVAHIIINNFFPLTVVFSLILFFNRKKLLVLLTSLLLVTQTSFMTYSLWKTSLTANDNNAIIQTIKSASNVEDFSPKIIYISRGDKFSESFWDITSLFDFKTDLFFFDEEADMPNEIDLTSLTLKVTKFAFNQKSIINNGNNNGNVDVSDYDFIISTLPIRGLKEVANNFNVEFIYRVEKSDFTIKENTL